MMQQPKGMLARLLEAPKSKVVGAEEFSSRLTLHFTRFIARRERDEEQKILNAQNYCFSAEKNFLPEALKKNYSFLLN